MLKYKTEVWLLFKMRIYVMYVMSKYLFYIIIVSLTHLSVFCSTAGRVYSCITKMSEGSHSTVNPMVSLLKPTGHTKYWN